MSISREQWKDILEGIGFLAIIASLIFVGIETRNSTKQAILTTRTLEVSAYQDLIDNILEMNISIMENPETAALMRKFWNTLEPLSEIEEHQFRSAAFQRLRHGDMAYFQYERGAIDEERLRSVLRIMRLGHPRMKAFWAQHQDKFVQGFRDYINWLIEQPDVQT